MRGACERAAHERSWLPTLRAGAPVPRVVPGLAAAVPLCYWIPGRWWSEGVRAEPAGLGLLLLDLREPAP